MVNKNATIDVCHTSSVSSGRYGNVILTLPLSLAFFLNGSHLSNDSLEVSLGLGLVRFNVPLDT